MKNYKNILISTLLALSIFVVGCNTTQVQNPESEARVLSHLRTGVTLACSAALISVEDQSKKLEIAKQIYLVSDLVITLTNSGDLAPDKLRAVLDEFFPQGSEYAVLSPSISELYKSAFINVDGDSVKATKYLKAIAEACKTVSSTYYKPSN